LLTHAASVWGPGPLRGLAGFSWPNFLTNDARSLGQGRFVSQKSLVDSLEEGFKNATGGDTREIRKQIDEFRDCFKEAIAKGDTFDMVYLPNHGVSVSKNGKLKGAVAGTKFKQALFSIWLSSTPADATLKQALLTTGKVR